MTNTQFKYTISLLSEYCTFSLKNAAELLTEGLMLLAAGHRARAYFLAVAAIEEAGKAFLAFEGQGRNLNDSAVTARLRRALEDHSQKVTSAFIPMFITSPDIRQMLMPMIDLMIGVKRGREPSMYTDIDYESGEIRQPTLAVREAAARDCIRLAGDCLLSVQQYVKNRTPSSKSAVDDELFSLRPELMRKILNREDFWWFYIDRLEAGALDFATAVTTYRREYVDKEKVYRRLSNSNPTDDQTT